MKKNVKNTILLSIILAIIFSIFNYSHASTNEINNELDESLAIENLEFVEKNKNDGIELMANPPVVGNEELSGRLFFIKNAYTGQYLDVAGGVAANGTNVQQYKYNGSSAQLWYIHAYGNGDFSILSPIGTDDSYLYALDIKGGSGDNYANAQIYEFNASDAQKFCLAKVTYGGAYILYTKCSDYKKAVVLNGPTCAQGGNVDQYTFQAHINELWILEPAIRDDSMGVWYANYNVEEHVAAYPNLDTPGFGDCTNFVSQCMLASGVHFTSDWKVYRKNNNYNQPNNVEELDDTWELISPKTSPWISAPEFYNYWKKTKTIYTYRGSYILEHPNEILNLPITKGDVIQYSEKDILGAPTDVSHSMYITDIGTDSSGHEKSYLLTYHSSPVKGRNLLDICEQHPNYIFIFYDI